jgi:hypothetical protein
MEIEQGGLRRLLLVDFQQLLGKACAQNAPAFPPLPQRRRSHTKTEKLGRANTTFCLLPNSGVRSPFYAPAISVSIHKIFLLRPNALALLQFPAVCPGNGANPHASFFAGIDLHTVSEINATKKREETMMKQSPLLENADALLAFGQSVATVLPEQRQRCHERRPSRVELAWSRSVIAT